MSSPQNFLNFIIKPNHIDKGTKKKKPNRNITVYVAIGISFLSLLVSAFSLYESHKANRISNRLNDIQIKQNRPRFSYDGTKMDWEDDHEFTKKADNYSKCCDYWKFRFMNMGERAAKNIKIEIKYMEDEKSYPDYNLKVDSHTADFGEDLLIGKDEVVNASDYFCLRLVDLKKNKAFQKFGFYWYARVSYEDEITDEPFEQFFYQLTTVTYDKDENSLGVDDFVDSEGFIQKRLVELKF